MLQFVTYHGQQRGQNNQRNSGKGKELRQGAITVNAQREALHQQRKLRKNRKYINIDGISLRLCYSTNLNIDFMTGHQEDQQKQQQQSAHGQQEAERGSREVDKINNKQVFTYIYIYIYISD